MKHSIQNLILISHIFFSSCTCEDICNYSFRDVTVLNNTAKVIEIELPQKFGTTNETLRPFEGMKYIELISNEKIIVRIKGNYVESFLIDPCTPNLIFRYDE